MPNERGHLTPSTSLRSGAFAIFASWESGRPIVLSVDLISRHPERRRRNSRHRGHLYQAAVGLDGIANDSRQVLRQYVEILAICADGVIQRKCSAGQRRSDTICVQQGDTAIAVDA